MNLYKLIISYLVPQSTGLNILATSPQEAEHRLKTAIDYDNAPDYMKLKLDSCELVQEGIEGIDEAGVNAAYAKIDERTIN